MAIQRAHNNEEDRLSLFKAGLWRWAFSYSAMNDTIFSRS